MDGNRRIISLALPVFDKEMETAAVNALNSERFVLGEEVFKFEEEFASYLGVKHAVSTSSGTNALQIALLALGVSCWDEVITSAFSFIASANAVLHAGATPVFADIDVCDFNVDIEEVKLKISKRTKALLPVHLFGYPCKMNELMEIAEDKGFYVIEDACQAHGSEYDGRKVGGIGDVGCFSFYPSKNMTVCGDGGMLVTNDANVAKLAGKLRDCGRTSQYKHDVVGYTSRLNTVNAAIGRVQLRRLDRWNKVRRENALVYDKLLAEIEEVVLPPKKDMRVKPAYHLYVIKARKRDQLHDWLLKAGVGCGVHYPLPIPMQPVYKKRFGFRVGEYSLSELVSKKCLSLPVHPGLTEDDINFICGKIQEFYRQH